MASTGTRRELLGGARTVRSGVRPGLDGQPGCPSSGPRPRVSCSSRAARPFGATSCASGGGRGRSSSFAGVSRCVAGGAGEVKLCLDCIAEKGEAKARKLGRPAPHPGPRCVSHHRAIIRIRRARSHERTVQRVYGLTPGLYRVLYEAQNGLCAICHRASGKSKRLAVDHDHACCPGPNSCGKCVRGLLCGVCNRVILGWYTPEMLERALRYLSSPPAQALDTPRDA